jgi:hypothetical protein
MLIFLTYSDILLKLQWLIERKFFLRVEQVVYGVVVDLEI